MLFGRNGEFGVEDICDLRFCGRGIGLLVMGSLKRGPLAAFSDNSERFLCKEAPSWHFLPVFDFFAGRFFRVVFCWVATMWVRTPCVKWGGPFV